MHGFALTVPQGDHLLTNTIKSKTSTWFLKFYPTFNWLKVKIKFADTLLGLVSSHSISVEWFDAKAHHSPITDDGLNLSEHLHRDSVDLNLILRRGDKLAKPIAHRTTTTTYV